MEARSLGFSEVVVSGGDWLRGVGGERDISVGRGGGEAQKGSIAGGENGKYLKSGGIKVYYITQQRDIS